MGKFLSNQQKGELRGAHRREEEVRYADRIKAILSLDNGLSYEEVGEVLLCDERTVRRYEELYLSGGLEALLRDDYQGKSGRLSPEQEEELKKQLR